MDHILITRLIMMGISDLALKWFTSYLTNRNISVDYSRGDKGIVADAGIVADNYISRTIIVKLNKIIEF